MKLLKLGAGVLNQTPMDWAGNTAHIIAAIDDARDRGVSILCLPELCITGYGCEDMFHAPVVLDTSLALLAEIAPHTRGMVVTLGLPLQHRKAVYDAACLLVDGRIAGFPCKRSLAGDGLHYEPRWFKPWPAGRRGVVAIDGARYPIGDLHFDFSGVKVGFEICEDAWVADRPGSGLSLLGVDIILNPSGSHFSFGKLAIRERFVVEGSRAFGVAYVYSNLLGNEAGRVIYDGGALIASRGRLLARGPRLSFRDVIVTDATIDLDGDRLDQIRRASHRPSYDDATGCVSIDFELPTCEPAPAVDHGVESAAAPTAHRGVAARPPTAPGVPEPSTALSPSPTGDPGADPTAELPPRPLGTSVDHAPVADWEDGPDLREEEFCRAVALALHDYLRKSRARGYAVSLSGGADSAAVAVLAGMAVELPWAELGADAVKDRLGHIPGVREADTPRAMIHRLLATAYQSTANSSAVTRDAARQVAEAVGAEHLELDVDGLVTGYIDRVQEALGRSLTWERDDLALQNIQARARGPGIWLLANLRGALLLATSNRSEAAVGYATMDGDTCGGVSPIAGIDKAFLRRWLAWMERSGPRDGRPMAALAAVNAQAPTAELRPREAGQTDEADLMPYDLLDAIEEAAIGDKASPIDVFRIMQARFPAYPPRQLGLWVERFYRLWCTNQWKRERYAPSFHLDDTNLDPKTWCRFPILSGGFARELASLRAYIAQISPE